MMFAVVKDCKRNPEKLSKIKRGESHSAGMAILYNNQHRSFTCTNELQNISGNIYLPIFSSNHLFIETSLDSNQDTGPRPQHCRYAICLHQILVMYRQGPASLHPPIRAALSF